MGNISHSIFNMGKLIYTNKKGLTGLTPIQLGSLRVIVTTIIIAPIGYQKIKHIPRQKMKWVALSAFVGSFFPAYLFAFAETEISSSITAVMVSLTPQIGRAHVRTPVTEKSRMPSSA